MTPFSTLAGIVLSVALAGAGLQDKPAPPAAKAQDPAAAKQATVTGTPVTLNATVEAIDVAGRNVSLKGPKGNVVEVHVPETYTRFNELKVGDTVSATYNEAIAFTLRKAGSAAATTAPTETIVGGAGAKGRGVARQLTANVTITAIDKAAPSVTVKGPKGNVYSMRVQDPKRLEGVAVGDTIEVTYTEALLLTVDRTAKK
jgi:hypothetical protein